MLTLDMRYFPVGFSASLFVVFAAELIRVAAGFYNEVPWYAAIPKFFIRIHCFAAAFGLLAAYAMGSGVIDASLVAVRGYSVLMPPGLALLIVGGLAAFVALGLAEVVAMLVWASARRRVPWQVFQHAEEWCRRRIERWTERMLAHFEKNGAQQ